MNTTVLQAIANKVLAITACGDESCNGREHAKDLFWLVHNHMPCGGGFDGGTEINLDRSTPDKLVFKTAYHHMNADGYYDGWTKHTVTITPSFLYGMRVNVSGQNRNDIKDYIADTFINALNAIAQKP